MPSFYKRLRYEDLTQIAVATGLPNLENFRMKSTLCQGVLQYLWQLNPVGHRSANWCITVIFQNIPGLVGVRATYFVGEVDDWHDLKAALRDHPAFRRFFTHSWLMYYNGSIVPFYMQLIRSSMDRNGTVIVKVVPDGTNIEEVIEEVSDHSDNPVPAGEAIACELLLYAGNTAPYTMLAAAHKTVGHLARRTYVQAWFRVAFPHATSCQLLELGSGTFHTTASDTRLSAIGIPRFRVIPLPVIAAVPLPVIAAVPAAAEPATTFGEIPHTDWLPHHLTPAARASGDSSNGTDSEELDLDEVVDAPMAIAMNPIDNDGSLQSMMNRPVQDGVAKQT